MKEERNIITIDEYGNISLPTDIGATAMTEWEICELFGVITPTVRAGIKALCKSGVLKEYGIKRLVRLSDRSSIEVYDLETIAALAFRIESFGAAKVRKLLLDRIMNGRKKKRRLSCLSLPTPSRAADGWRNGLSVGVSVRNTVIHSYGHTVTRTERGCFPTAGKRSSHSRLQRRSKHGAFRRLQGRAATPLGEQSPPSCFG